MSLAQGNAFSRRSLLAAAAGLGLVRALRPVGGSLDAVSALVPSGGHPPYRPPRGSALLIAGQGSGDIGDYLDRVALNPAGITLYTGLPRTPSAGPAVGVDQALLDRVPNSVLHLSVNWTHDFPIGQPQIDEQLALQSGEKDASIDKLAQWCADLDRPILIRLGYEFDRVPPYYYDKSLFADGFRYVVDRFRNLGVANVAWVWASTNFLTSPDKLTDANFNDWYPGDSYVDWFGFSMWYPDIEDDVIMRQARRQRDKPVLLAETTPVTYNVSTLQHFPGSAPPPVDMTAAEMWDRWWGPMVSFVHANADIIAGWHYISTDWTTDSMWSALVPFSHCDSRIWVNTEIREKWVHAISQPPFLAGETGLFEILGTQPPLPTLATTSPNPTTSASDSPGSTEQTPPAATPQFTG